MKRSLFRFFRQIFNLFAHSRLFLRWKNSRRFPGLGIDKGVSLEVCGALGYGEACSIGIGSAVLVPDNARLTLGDGCYIGRNVEICPSHEINIGADTSIQDRCTILGNVYIGRHCLFGSNVYVSSGRHHFDLYPSWLIRDQDNAVANDKCMRAQHDQLVTIEDDCWIGTNAVLMAGIVVGKGAVIGANSVVNADVHPYAVVAGAPARELRRRLEYSPPTRIHFSDQMSWPYFYSGFQMSQSDIARYSEFGGIAALGEFSISLDFSSASALHLIIKKITKDACHVIFEEQKFSIQNSFRKIVLSIPESIRHSHQVDIKPETAGCTLIVSQAWVV
jgi:acetyltransferase-like isoleucine patch superfamily enzyme